MPCMLRESTFRKACQKLKYCKMQDTLELLMKVAPCMQNDPRYVFDQPEYFMSKELREYAKAKSKEFRKDRVNREDTSNTL